MGCFSFLCKKSGKPALSTSFDGSPVRMYLLKDGKVIEEMYGNYDSYGRVFTLNKKDPDHEKHSFKWSMHWRDVCNLIFNSNPKDGIAIVLDCVYDPNDPLPETQSEHDPNQGWGDPNDEEEPNNLMANTSDDMFKLVEEPYHKVY